MHNPLLFVLNPGQVINRTRVNLISQEFIALKALDDVDNQACNLLRRIFDIFSCD